MDAIILWLIALRIVARIVILASQSLWVLEKEPSIPATVLQKHRPGECCSGGNCGGIQRRDFIKTLTLDAAATAMPFMAGAFEPAERNDPIPADKKLDPDWVQSLFDRGKHEVYRGKERHLAFVPRLAPERFRAAFTAAECWGTFSQTDADGRRKAAIKVRWGKLALKTLGLMTLAGTKPNDSKVVLAGKPVDSHFSVADSRATSIEFAMELTIDAGQELIIAITRVLAMLSDIKNAANS